MVAHAPRDGSQDDMSTPPRDTEPPPPDPTSCPFCRATTLRSPGEKFDANAYWRCEACGEMWNAARLQTSSRHNHDRRWR
jgi:hypothetical protein